MRVTDDNPTADDILVADDFLLSSAAWAWINKSPVNDGPV